MLAEDVPEQPHAEGQHAGCVGDDLQRDEEGREEDERAREVLEVAQPVTAQAEQVVQNAGRNREREGHVHVLRRWLQEEQRPGQVAHEDEEGERGDQGQVPRAPLADRLLKQVAHPRQHQLDELLQLAGIVLPQAPRDGHTEHRDDSEDEQGHHHVIRHVVGQALLCPDKVHADLPSGIDGLVEDGMFSGGHDD